MLKAPTEASRASARAAPRPETSPEVLFLANVLCIHISPTGPTGTAIAKPTNIPQDMPRTYSIMVIDYSMGLCYSIFAWYSIVKNGVSLFSRLYRLTVRTSAFQALNQGSTPCRVTNWDLLALNSSDSLNRLVSFGVPLSIS